jgi:hypothetical protein
METDAFGGTDDFGEGSDNENEAGYLDVDGENSKECC